MYSLMIERRLTPDQTARQAGVSLSTIGRWFGRGVKGVRLESFVIGGRRYTTVEAFERFIEATTAASSPSTLTPNVRTNRQRDAAVARAERELAKAGL